ncbi:hypothetical protein ACLOJK_028679 [Asimina triloba]
MADDFIVAVSSDADLIVAVRSQQPAKSIAVAGEIYGSTCRICSSCPYCPWPSIKPRRDGHEQACDDSASSSLVIDAMLLQMMAVDGHGNQVSNTAK